jgi:hypothetical protein
MELVNALAQLSVEHSQLASAVTAGSIQRGTCVLPELESAPWEQRTDASDSGSKLTLPSDDLGNVAFKHPTLGRPVTTATATQPAQAFAGRMECGDEELFPDWFLTVYASNCIASTFSVKEKHTQVRTVLLILR